MGALYREKNATDKHARRVSQSACLARRTMSFSRDFTNQNAMQFENTETEKGPGRERRHERGKNKVTDANATVVMGDDGAQMKASDWSKKYANHLVTS